MARKELSRMADLYRSSVNHGEDNGTPLQYPCLQNPMDGGAWWATVHGVAKSQTQLSDFTFTYEKSKSQACVQCRCEPSFTLSAG